MSGIPDRCDQGARLEKDPAMRESGIDKLNILLGVSGGVAAYKAVDLASKATAAGANVNTVMTEAACQLIGPKSFEAVTCSAVFASLWSGPNEYSSSHIS